MEGIPEPPIQWPKRGPERIVCPVCHPDLAKRLNGWCTCNQAQRIAALEAERDRLRAALLHVLRCPAECNAHLGPSFSMLKHKQQVARNALESAP